METLQKLENKGELVANLLDRFDLFWNVKKEKLYTGDGTESNHFSIRREDTNEEFFAPKESYEVFQNWEMIDMMYEIASRSNLELAKGGHFNGGRKVYLKLDTGSIKGIGENNDEIKKYITVLNCHDGTGSLSLGMTNITLSCANTFHRMYKEMNTRIRHSSKMRDKIDILMKGIDLVRQEEQTLYDKFWRMAEVEADDTDIKRLVQAITGVDLNMSHEDAQEKYTKGTIEKAAKLTGRIAEETAQKGQTLWGLFSGVTSYTNRDVRSKRNDLLENKIVGSCYTTDNKAFNLIEKEMLF